MKHTKSTVFWSLILILLASCAPAAPEFEESILIRVTYRESITWAPIIIAQKEGFFAAQGLNVELAPALNTGEAIAAMKNGDLEVHAGVPNVAQFNALLQGENVKIVADKGILDPNSCTSVAAMISPDSEIKTPADLAGAKVSGLPSIVTVGYLLGNALEGTDVSLSSMEFTNIPPASEGPGLKDGSLDLIFTSEPWITHIQESGEGVIFLTGKDYIPNTTWGVILFGNELLEEKPEVGRRFMVAYLQAVRQFNEGKTERNLEIMTEATGLETELLEKICWPAIAEDGYIFPETITGFLEWAKGEGFIDDIVPVEDFWDPSFVDFANQELK